MKVGELVKELSQYPRDIEIFVMDCRTGVGEELVGVGPTINDHKSVQGDLLDYPDGKQYMGLTVG